MAFSQQKFPAIRLSDIDDLMRENALDSSDGQMLIDYIRRKQGAGRPRLNLLLDGAENPINFRLDHLQPLAASLSPSKTNDATDAPALETASDTASTNASPGIALVQPHSVNNRIASFITPSKNGTSSTPTAGSRDCNPKSPPSQRASPVHRLLSPSRIPVQRASSGTNLSRKTLIKECQRANQMKCEIIRQIVSSTPKPGEKQERSNDNFMSIRETISPIFEERVAPMVARVDAVQAQLNGTVPATQDQPDAIDRDARESTPPRGDGAMVVIPETPSPVHKSPMRTASPFSALKLHRSPSMRKLTDQQQRTSMAASQQQPKRSMAVEALRIDESVEYTPQKSILKKRTTKISVEPMVVSPSPRNRVSFSEQLISVRELSPAYVRSPRHSDVTSDESSEEAEEENFKVKQRKDMHRTSHGQLVCTVWSPTKPTVQLRKSSLNSSATMPTGQTRKSQLTRSEAFDEQVESLPANRTNEESERTGPTIEEQMEAMHQEDRSPCRPQSLTRRSLSFDDIIRRGAVPRGDDPPSKNGEQNELETDRLERNREQPLPQPVPSPVSSPKDKRKNKTISDAVNMVMEDSTRNGSNDVSSQQEQGQDDGRLETNLDAIASPGHRTISSPMAITNIDTPRTVLMDIYDPPSAFCDDDNDDSDDDNDDSSLSNNTPNEVEVPTQATEETDPQRQSDKLSKSRKRRSVSPCPKESEPGVQSACEMRQNVLKTHERIVSVSSPQDHVSFKLTSFVDRLVSQEEPVLPQQRPADGDDQARRETIVVPSKRRRAKPSIDNDTESYFQAVEQPQKTKDAKSKRGSQRRKLFPREKSGLVDELDENIPSPEPLPMTQEDEAVPETQPAVEPKCVPVSRPMTKQLAVIIERLSMATLKRLQEGQGAKNKNDAIEMSVNKEEKRAGTSQPKSPVEEKQNTEPSEKDREVSSSTGSDGIDSGTSGKRPPVPRQGRGRGRPKKDPKNVEQGQKYWKDISNELRQHVESDGIRKSNRKRCLSKQVLMRNPLLSRNDEPKYVMPTFDELLVLYGEQEKKRQNSKKNVKDKKKATKKPISTETRIDDDGFRIPPVPITDGSTQTSAGKKRTIAWSEKQPEAATANGNGHCPANGESLDSGLSSAVMTSDDVTETIPPPVRQKPSSSATVSSTADGDPGGQKGGESAVSASVGSTEDILTAKRQAMDWMYMLMENQQQQQAKLMPIDIQGFTHCSIDHLSFQRRGDIEYSFYIYSKYDNFGFVRFLPNAKKKMTRLNNFHLKFLVLNGSLTFVINELEVKAVGGDFLLLPIGCSYKVLNGPDVSLMFMIKTIEGLRQ
ncbi:uncharacterized protein LOC131284912 [Anopheles ziemanni]|uniref:uncharacterized protein LOC131271347 n=1 Tax=Anopheles coustani TaxID=139045 RepID=UPI00265B0F6C|nr:uncharacterized protein LOC131271347 [Anopheles coustani]XP_058169754.1 uncharacterized protein LOC131284912 [Anopheles ziemanni]